MERGMTHKEGNLLEAISTPWMAYVFMLAGCALLLGASELVIRVLGAALVLAGTLWLAASIRKIRGLLGRLLAAAPLPDKSEAILRDLPKAWFELEQENLALRTQARRDDQIRMTILANLRVGLVLFDPERKIQLFNPAAQQLLGTSSRLSIGGDLVTAFREPGCLRYIERASQGLVMEWVLHRDPRIIQARAIPMTGPEEGAVLLTLDDITRQEALETTRQKFISNASHELKTPTTSIRIAAENLQDGKFVAPDGEASLQSIFRSVDRMTLLLNDISELSRIETGALLLKPEEVHIPSFLASLQDDLKPQVTSRRIRLRTSLQDELADATFRADPLRLHQLLENLLSNAIKFSPEDSEVLVAVRRDGPWLVWSVQDHGPGIAPSETLRVFERFYRSPSARGVPGTGLGLSIVKHLSVLMNGEIDVDSELGQGSTFTLRIPLAEIEP
jgi:two-component system, OmpR family, phosphate regulon sensor histidine kinase PhoR